MIDETKKQTCIKMVAMAREKLRAVEELFKAGCYDDSLSRSYYGAFHIVSMLLFLENKTFSRHGQVIGAFNHDYIASGLLPKELSKALGSLFDDRQTADYDIFQHANLEEARLGLENAWSIYIMIMEFANEQFGFTFQELS